MKWRKEFIGKLSDKIVEWTFAVKKPKKSLLSTLIIPN